MPLPGPCGPTRLTCPRCKKRKGRRRHFDPGKNAYCLHCGHQWDQGKHAKKQLDDKLKALDKKWRAKHG